MYSYSTASSIPNISAVFSFSCGQTGTRGQAAHHIMSNTSAKGLVLGKMRYAEHELQNELHGEPELDTFHRSSIVEYVCFVAQGREGRGQVPRPVVPLMMRNHTLHNGHVRIAAIVIGLCTDVFTQTNTTMTDTGGRVNASVGIIPQRHARYRRLQVAHHA